jgi:hypothetical protein
MPHKDRQEKQKFERENYAKNIEARRAKARIENMTEAQRERKLEHARKTRAKNRERFNAKSREYNANNRERLASLTLVRRFGITLAEYDKMFNEQGGVCKICGGTNGTIRLAVDHDHDTGKVRGLLCTRCNLVLGSYEILVANREAFENYLTGANG